MNVFLLYCGKYEEDGIVGIFSSKAKALEVGLEKCDDVIEYDSDGQRHCHRPTPEIIESRIVEFELDVAT